MKSTHYIFISLAFCLVALALQLWLGDYFNSTTYHESSIRQSVINEIEAQEVEMIDVLDSLSTSNFVRFSDFDLDKSYPYFIFRKGRLLVWSDYHFVPDYTAVSGDYVYKPVLLNNSYFITRQWTVENNTSTYEVFSFVPLKRAFNLQNKYLSTQWNSNIFLNDDVRISFEEREDYLPVKIRDEYLLSVKVGPRYLLTTTPFNVTIAVLYALALIVLAFALVSRYFSVTKENKFRFALLAILGYWIFVKLILHVFDFPDSLIDLDLFDPQYFAVSWFEQSFADMLINTMFILIVAVLVFFNFHRFKFYKYLTQDSTAQWLKYMVGVLTMLLSFFIVNYQYLQLRTIYFNSQISLDIIQSLEVDKFRVLAYLVFVVVALSTGILLHISVRILSKLITGLRQYLIIITGGTGLFFLASYVSNIPTGNLALVTLMVVLFFLITRMPAELAKGNYKSAIYILILVLLNAAIGSWCIQQFEYERELISMRKYASELIMETDNLAEFLINEAAQAIASDPFIATRITNPFLSKESIVKKVQRQFINPYLDKYDVSVFLYFQSGEGVPGYGTDIDYLDIQKRYAVSGNRTEYKNLYFINHTGPLERNRYITFIPVKKYDRIAGYLILDFKQNKVVPSEVYPELLKDSRFAGTDYSEYSYAIYAANTLVQKYGEFLYPTHFYTPANHEGWLEKGYWHLSLSNFENEIAVVSIPSKLYYRLFSNFSFLVIVLLLPMAFGYLFYGWYIYRRNRQLSYSAKIQTYLNLAFFIPLLVVTITTLSLITSSFKQALVEDKLAESKMLAEKIVKQLDDYLIGGSSREVLTEKLADMVAYGRIDANIYGVNGKLIATTQPGVFSARLISPYVNTRVLQEIVEQGNANSFQRESIGSLKYYSSYSAIKSNDTDRLLGVVGIPFFQSETTLQESRIDALTTIINLFVLIFLLALLATYLTSKWLTYPLTLIRQKLEHVSFAQHNDPLDWDSDDEIGLLVTEYNNMLLKLEESKHALARSQKESAWREVAQQVAHEIKNPLTPMKLTIQKLQRSVDSSGESGKQITGALKNLLGQLNTLNDIVTSFSDFAKMPIPKSEKIDLIAVVKDVCSMFSSDKSLDIQLHFHADKAFIMSDKKLMGRIISNILINSSQSRKEGQDRVNVEIVTEHLERRGLLRLSFKDNGKGIPAAIRDRIFMPKFSTKDEGSGIGLAVAKHGVEQGGGNIWVESEEGVGTTFIIEFPINNPL